MAISLAFLSTELPKSGSAVQLLPIGEFAAKDGRPGNLKDVSCKTWVLTKQRAQEIAAAFSKTKNKLLFDYEHAALFLKGTGQKVPAAGWGAGMVVNDDGLYAEPVEWTPNAAKMIADKEYLYTSPVFSFNTETGEVLGVSMCALTNDPALDGLSELQVALSKLPIPIDDEGNSSMDKLLEKLRWFLNLPVTTTAQEAAAELDKLKAMLSPEAQAAASFDLAAHVTTLAKTTTAQATQIAALTAQVAAAQVQSGEPDPAKYVSVTALTAAQATIAELTGKLNGGSVDTMIAAAEAEGRLLGAADAQWARSLAARHGVAELQAALSARQPIPALQGTQTQGKPPVSNATAALTAEQKEAARLMGHSEADYAAMLKPQ